MDISALYVDLEAAQEKARASGRACNEAEFAWRKSKSKIRGAAFVAAREIFEAHLAVCDDLYRQIDVAEREAQRAARKAQRALHQQLDLFA